jgi:hypothetical protein
MAAKYKQIKCHRCGEPFTAAQFSEVWDMRVDGVLHKVPLHAIPCMYCTKCDISVVDGCSDEQIMWCYGQYITKNGLNTPRHRVFRWFRRQYLRIQDSWTLFFFRLQEKRNAS